MHVIECDQVIGCNRCPISPGPADRNSCVKEVMDMIVENGIVRRLADPNADGARKVLSAVVNLAIADHVRAG